MFARKSLPVLAQDVRLQEGSSRGQLELAHTARLSHGPIDFGWRFSSKRRQQQIRAQISHDDDDDLVAANCYMCTYGRQQGQK